jgi:hypothetical protein
VAWLAAKALHFSHAAAAKFASDQAVAGTALNGIQCTHSTLLGLEARPHVPDAQSKLHHSKSLRLPQMLQKRRANIWPYCLTHSRSNAEPPLNQKHPQTYVYCCVTMLVMSPQLNPDADV